MQFSEASYELQVHPPDGVGHSVRAESSHHAQFLERCLVFPFLWELLLFWALTLNKLLPPFGRTLDIAVEVAEVIHVGERLRYNREQVQSVSLHTSIHFFIFLFECFTRYLMFRIAVLPHRPGTVYYHLLLRRETRIPGVAPFSFRIGIWDLFVHRGQKSYTTTALGKMWTTPGVRCMKHASS